MNNSVASISFFILRDTFDGRMRTFFVITFDRNSERNESIVSIRISNFAPSRNFYMSQAGRE